jgi:transposase
MPETLFLLPEEQPISAHPGKGRPRLERANRQQVEIRLASLDELLAEDHRARIVWEVVAGYDLSGFYARIEAIEGEAGRPAIDPRVLVAVWLYATLEGVGSARQLDRLCKEHLAYQWLLGGVSVNYHTLADFRVDYEAELDQLLTHSVAALMQEGLVDLEQTAQDGCASEPAPGRVPSAGKNAGRTSAAGGATHPAAQGGPRRGRAAAKDPTSAGGAGTAGPRSPGPGQTSPARSGEDRRQESQKPRVQAQKPPRPGFDQ